MNIVKLISSDNETVEADMQILKCSNTIKTMMELCGLENTENVVVPLPKVNSSILRKVLVWAEYHKNDPQPTEDDNEKEKRSDDISPWDSNFMKVDQGTMFALMNAANYLDIKALFELSCKTTANIIKSKSTPKIRETFNITNDFTPAEERQLRVKHGLHKYN